MFKRILSLLKPPIFFNEKNQAERERLIQELSLKNAESEILRESFASIINTVDFKEIIQRILEQIKRLIPYDQASVWTIEDNYQKFFAGRNLPHEMKNSHPLDSKNSALSLLQGNVAYILNNNVQEELPDFNDPPDHLINSWLAIPLKTRGKVIGTIALDGYQRGQFNEHHVNLALDFANQVAIALENAQLFSELQNELAERKRLIEELELRNAELEQFNYTVSHDLKTPLVTIKGYLGYLVEDVTSGNVKRLTQDTQRIADAVDKMNKLLRDMLELSRVSHLRNPLQEVSLEEIIHEVMGLVNGQMETKGIALLLQPNLPVARVDRQHLRDALHNLIDNSIKYMGDQPEPKIEIGHHGEESGKSILFVRDNGIGVASEYHEMIFGLFNKLNPASEGTGIGLALVKRIIEVHGGRIWVESEAGRGSTFYFTLPVSTMSGISAK